MNTSKDLVRTWGFIAALGMIAAGCSVSTGTGPEASAPKPHESVAPAKSEKVGKKSSEVKSEEAPQGPRLVHKLEGVGFEAPDAIFYDADADVYYVSNVNGDPLAEDGNGFISKVGPDGKVQELKWIDGQKAGVTLNAPKGMAVSQGFLYVSDITWIRVFDRKTGEPKGKIYAKGATFLNGLSTNEKGEIVFSDTGWKSGKDGFKTTGSDAVFRIDPKTVAAKELARGKELGNPNGVVGTKEGLWVVNDQGELFLMGKDGKKEKTTKLAKGGLDGVVALDDGSFLVSSWKANAIYQGKPGEKFEVLLSDLKSPASIGFDTKRGRVLVPKMLENVALIYDISGKPAASAPDAGGPDHDGATASSSEEKAQAPAPAATSPTKEEATDKPTAATRKTTADAKPAAPGKTAAAEETAASQKAPAVAKPSTVGKPATSAKPKTPAEPAAPKESGKPGAKPAVPEAPAQPAAGKKK